jgi:flagellum-specific peptidoglycan hydrolase FlgJ
VPHANIVLAQARLESGNFKSDFYRKTNNLFGLKKSGRYATYKTWRDSIKDYKLRISARYQGGSYYTFLENIKYATNPNYRKLLEEIVNGKNRH